MRSAAHKDVRTPKYRPRIIENKKKRQLVKRKYPENYDRLYGGLKPWRGE